MGKYYPKLTIISGKSTKVYIYDSNETETINKCKDRVFRKDGHLDCIEIDNNLAGSYLVNQIKYIFISIKGKYLKINKETLIRLINSCCIDKGLIYTNLIFLKEKNSWVPYSIDSAVAKDAINKSKYNKTVKGSTIGNLTIDFKFDYSVFYKTYNDYLSGPISSKVLNVSF